MEELKKYLYYIHPDLHYFKRFKSPYKSDITSIYSNLTQGVLMSGDPDNYGMLYSDDRFEKDKDLLLYYLENKYSNLKAYHGAKRYSEEGVPLYVIKFPYQYLKGAKRGNDFFMPMPMIERFETTDVNSIDKDFNMPTFYNEFRFHPELNYGVYSKELGGFIQNPGWTPVPDFMGYTFNKHAIPPLLYNREGEIIDQHINELKTKADVLKYEQSIGNEIFLHHNTQEIIDRYKEIYKFDLPTYTDQIKESDIYRQFNMNWDITTGLTPGDHRKDERLI